MWRWKYSFDHKLHVKIHSNGKPSFEIVIFHNVTVFFNQINAALMSINYNFFKSVLHSLIFCYVMQCHSDICNSFLSVQMLFRVIECSYSMGHSLLMHTMFNMVCITLKVWFKKTPMYKYHRTMPFVYVLLDMTLLGKEQCVLLYIISVITPRLSHHLVSHVELQHWLCVCVCVCVWLE